VQANAYYTPRSAQGLAVHHDTHDVVVLQLAGEKRWLVYEPVLELPLKHQHYSRELGEPGETVYDVTLRAGDTLYLPRGWLHEALTSNHDSLHLTIGVNVYTWVDALKAAVESCGDDVEFRRSVPSDGEPTVDLIDRLAERLAPEAVARTMRNRFVRTRRPVLEGQLGQLRAAAELDPDTPLHRRPTVIAELESDGETATVTYGGKRIAFPAHVRDELEFVLTVPDPFTLAELPGDLDDAGRRVLGRRLIREGILAVSPSAPGDAPWRNGGGARA
jgi:ribosomal protein L16 Arg81 hydroxylase